MRCRALPAVAWVLIAVLVAVRAPDARAAITKGPYLQNLSQSAIVVRWETSMAQRGVVQYGLTRAFGSSADQPDTSTQHEIELAGLLPDTLYHYRAVSGSDTSASATFYTPVRPGKNFRFLVYGDNRSNAAAHRSVVEEMSRVNPPGRFVINTGDLTSSGSASEYQSFFDVTQELISREPLFPCVGNHDKGNPANWSTYLTLPGNESWYTFRYGNVAFYSLDLYSPYAPGDPQYTWFLGQLEADSADASVRHIIVSFHEPPYTTNSEHESNLSVRKHICPMLERFQVKLTFQGHVHCYEHSLVNGVHYVTSGGGGAPLYTDWNPAQPWTLKREASYEFVQVDVRGDTLAVKTIRPGGAVMDSFAVVEERSAAPKAGRSGRGR